MSQVKIKYHTEYQAKESLHRGPGFGLPLGRGKGALPDADLLEIFMACWPPARRPYGSERVMEYWKKPRPNIDLL
jgi:hypothetical protein